MVDIVHHGVVGLAGALVAQHLGSPELAAGFLVGSILPDFDVAFMAFGKARFLGLHQSITHSLFVVPFLAFGIALLLSGLLDADTLAVFSGCLAGALLHVALDCMNTFGVRALWPMRRRTALDLFFFIDLPLLVLSISTLTVIWLFQADMTAAISWIGSLLVYGLSRMCWHRRVMRLSGAEIAIPSGLLAFSYFLTRQTPVGYELGSCRGWQCQVVWHDQININLPVAVEAILHTSSIYRDLAVALRLFRPVRVTVMENGWQVTSRCVAVRNFQNRYGEHVAIIKDGRLIDEAARL
jgi:membrane-bound metal-dependent hydrolase YbcI (DUF457 family)